MHRLLRVRRRYSGGCGLAARDQERPRQSHALVLLFTAPSKNWDWCLYETGLYTRFDRSEARAVVCLFSAGGASPSPLADVQGVPAEASKVRAFLDALCRRTWEVSDDWRRGALAPEIATDDQVEAAALRHYRGVPPFGVGFDVLPVPSPGAVVVRVRRLSAKGIPESARVMVGPNDTSGYTMSLFDLAGGEPAQRTWGDLLRAVDGTEAALAPGLDSRFLQALDEEPAHRSRPA